MNAKQKLVEDAIVSKINQSEFDNNMCSIDVIDEPIQHGHGLMLTISLFVYSDDDECNLEIYDLFLKMGTRSISTMDINLDELTKNVVNQIKKF